jgi:elongator complex protein 3
MKGKNVLSKKKEEEILFEKAIKELIDYKLKKKITLEKFNTYKNKICKAYKLARMPTNIEVLLHANKQEYTKLKDLVTKPTRTMSGVAVVAVMSKPHKCPHGKCITCPGGIDSNFGNVPQSYTGKEPATRRAIRNDYDPYLQVMNRLEQYIVTGHLPEKIELIIMGGTFISLPKTYVKNFVRLCFKAMNDFSKLFFREKEINFLKFKYFFMLPGNINDEERAKKIKIKLKKLKQGKSTLLEEQNRNEKSKVKCVSLVTETRPDYAKKKHIDTLLEIGCTKVELGVQTVFESVLKAMERGHSVQDTILATRLLKDNGFKINYHIMPGLYTSNKLKDIETFRILFGDQNFKPDMLKIYPCMVLEGTKLYELWKKGKYTPITTREAIDIIKIAKQNIPEYVRIMRVQRDIPTFMTKAGVDMTNLRQILQEEMKNEKIECNCIRCREITRAQSKKEKVKIHIRKYNASYGIEFFISVESGKSLIGLCRLRIPSETNRQEITKKTGLIRELHVYGAVEKIGEKGKIQHKGYGKKLLKIAEDICKLLKKDKVVIISGVGVRGYYRNLGYRKQGPYMVKKI